MSAYLEFHCRPCKRRFSHPLKKVSDRTMPCPGCGKARRVRGWTTRIPVGRGGGK